MNADQFCLERLFYNPASGIIVWKNGRNIGKKAGTLTRARYVGIIINGKRFYAHRIAWFLTHKKWPSDQIDHINGNGQDNRLANLRLASARDNRRNCKRYKNNTSGAKGVSWRKDRKTWSVRLQLPEKYISLGCFKDIRDAKDAYAKAAITHFGEFARIA